MKVTKTFPKGTDIEQIFVFVDDCLAGDNKMIEGDLYTTKKVIVTIEDGENRKDENECSHEMSYIDEDNFRKCHFCNKIID